MNPEESAIARVITRLGPLPEDELRSIVAAFHLRRYRPREIFQAAGEPLRFMGFNLKGIFRYFFIDYEGRDITKYFIMPNRFLFSLASFIDHSDLHFTIEALEESEAMVAPIGKIVPLIESSPYCQAMYRHLVENTFVEKEKREADFLLLSPKQRYLDFINEFPEESRRIRQYHIASYLGITPESLSRIRSQIENS